jgi:hypothetical protein
MSDAIAKIRYNTNVGSHIELGWSIGRLMLGKDESSVSNFIMLNYQLMLANVQRDK